MTCSAGLLWRSLENISAIRPAMDPDRRLLLVEGAFSGVGASVVERTAALAQGVAALPGIQNVAWARRAMLSGSGGGAKVGIEMPGQPRFEFPYNQISPSYFAATGARILSGRGFHESDSAKDALVVMVSSTSCGGSSPDAIRWAHGSRWRGKTGRSSGSWKTVRRITCGKPSSLLIFPSHSCRRAISR